jgi:hypothetical protein
VIVIWNAAIDSRNRLVQKYCLYTIINWINIIDKIDDDDVNYQSILLIFLDELLYQNFTILSSNEDSVPDYVSLFSYNNYLNRIFSDDISEQNVEIYFDYLFRFLYQVVDNGKLTIAESFISRCIDSSYYPSNRGAYSNLHSLVYQLMADNGIQDIPERLKPIPELGLYKMSYIGTVKELRDWEREFNLFIENGVSNLIEINEEIVKQIDLLKKSAISVYKFNKLQITVLKLLSLGFFKGDYETMKHALHYNQPPDSNAYQTNKDILPTSLPELLNLISYKYSLEHELLTFWSGHHGVEYYLDQVFCVLLYHFRTRRMYGEENVNQSAKAFCEFKLANDPGAIEGFKSHMERLRNMFEFHLKDGELKVQFFTNAEQIERTRTLIGDIITACEQAMDGIERNAALSDESVGNFMDSIIETYHAKDFLNRLFKKFGAQSEIIPTEKESFGINEMMDRTAFMKNWHIPYYGFSENRGRELAEQENRQAQFVLSAASERIKIKKNEIFEILTKYTGGEHIAIVRNLHLDMLGRRQEDFKPVYNDSDQENLIPGFYQGLFKDLPIFGLYDELFGESILIIDKSGFGYNEEQGEVKAPFVVKEEFKTSFIDFGTNNTSLQQMIANPPLWIKEEFKDNQAGLSDYLKKKVWLRLYKRNHFSVGDDFKSVLFQVEN